MPKWYESEYTEADHQASEPVVGPLNPDPDEKKRADILHAALQSAGIQGNAADFLAHLDLRVTRIERELWGDDAVKERDDHNPTQRR